ncbi:hypothetical protein M2322_003545 [Rhodoblastus acidophilus]|uniref:hypothetical protein n=1 Tax=Rhodoblastus acidophilus TaxID=1074 RepID=UPI00222533CE|nr:hypothetical protein [Rhodoblastus acidophilus]MCW2317980.1 hypothetical protein [Rhodoblastus acidophilus]
MKFFITLAIFALGVGYWVYDARPHFRDEDVANTKANIKTEFEKTNKDFAVDEVTLIRETDRKLTGYVKLTFKPSGEQVMKECSAILGDEATYVWHCQ